MHNRHRRLRVSMRLYKHQSFANCRSNPRTDVFHESFKLRFFVGHDGTMIRVASALGIGKLSPLRWPALGSEIVMEVRRFENHFVASIPTDCSSSGVAVWQGSLRACDVRGHPGLVSGVGDAGLFYRSAKLANTRRPVQYL